LRICVPSGCGFQPQIKTQRLEAAATSEFHLLRAPRRGWSCAITVVTLRRPARSRFFALAILLAVAAAAHGQTLITNGNFEEGTGQPAAGSYVRFFPGNSSITGWTIITDDLAWLNGTLPQFGINPSSGNLFLDLTGDSDAAPHGGVQQSFSTSIGATYRVTFDLGTGTGACVGPVSLMVSAGAASQTFTNSSTTTNWSSYFMDFTANAATTTLTLQGFSTPSGGIYIGLDNVSVFAIPEPSTWALLVFGGLTVAIAGWRRRGARPSLHRG
jgi:hypothetical protein